MKIAIDRFQAEIPKVANDLLPDGNASLAINCDVATGKLRSMRAPSREGPIGLTSCQSLYRYTEGSNSHWVVAQNIRHYVKSPIAGDQYERVYFTGETNGMRFFANDNISTPFNENSDYLLVGIPQPTGLSMGFTGGGAVYRAYVYSFVNTYGDEGPPSQQMSGENIDVTERVKLDNFQAAPAQRSIRKVRIYRTNSSAFGTAEFQMVCDAEYFSVETSYKNGEFVIYDDALWECTVASHSGAWNGSNFTEGELVPDADLLSVFPKVNFDPPPVGLRNLIGLANGSMAGFVGNTVYFSEPFYPHAWPPEYAIPLQTEIVGMANEKNVITVAGQGVPYVLQGTHPLAMRRVLGAEKLPLYSNRAICSGNSGVFFVTKQGLIFSDGVSFNGITQGLMRPEDWAEYDYESLFIHWYERRLFAFDPVSETGFFIDFTTGSAEVVRIGLFIQAGYAADDGHFYFVGLDTDIIDENAPPFPLPLAIFKWQGAVANHIQYTYQSKTFVVDSPINMAAALVMLDGTFYEDTAAEELTAILAQNQAEIAAGLNGSIGDGYPIGGPYMIAGDSLKSIASIRLSNYVSFKLFVDGVLRKTKLLNQAISRFRLPGNYMGHRIMFECQGYMPVKKVVIATSMDEL